MDSKIDDGGLAFPGTRSEMSQVFPDLPPVPVNAKYPGMTLRDWFAGQALIGMMGAMVPYSDDFERSASDAYKQADAMIAARKVGA